MVDWQSGDTVHVAPSKFQLQPSQPPVHQHPVSPPFPTALFMRSRMSAFRKEKGLPDGRETIVALVVLRFIPSDTLPPCSI